MAKKLICWMLDENVLAVARYTEDKGSFLAEAHFDLDKLFDVLGKPENADFKYAALAYLTKQKLSDTGAGAIGDAQGKICAAKDRWNELLSASWKKTSEDAERKASQKAAYGAVKAASEVKTLGGLLIKYTLSKTPGQPKLTEDEMKSFREMAEKAGIPIE